MFRSSSLIIADYTMDMKSIILLLFILLFGDVTGGSTSMITYVLNSGVAPSNNNQAQDTIPNHSGYTTPLEYEGMTLVWHDEFDGNVLDANHWTYALGTGCPKLCGWGNNELQHYTNKNTIVADGLLTISAMHERFVESDYTSSRILTRDKFDFKFGRVDIRAKLPFGKGIWPALWMLGANLDDIGWPDCGEIDIMELQGSDPSKICGTLHFENQDGHHEYSEVNCHILSNGGNFHESFHVFSIVWDEEQITWYMDDQQFNKELFSNLNLANKSNPFLNEFYLLMNVAVGGNYDGIPDKSTVFPQKMEVDYIRVFREN